MSAWSQPRQPGIQTELLDDLGKARDSDVDLFAPPLIILAPPKSFGSVVSAMLGQHPRLYSAPDLNLFAGDTLRELSAIYTMTNPRQQDGLLRTIAELFLNGQSENLITAARRWMSNNGRLSTIELFRKIAMGVSPKILIDKSVSTVWRPEHLLRVKEAFPAARYLHLGRHPRSHARAVLQSLDREAYLRPRMLDRSRHPPILDPQLLWFQMHDTIDQFLDSIPAENQYCVRGEDFLTDTDRTLRDVMTWLNLAVDDALLDAMRHPERSPYAAFGPLNASFGNNPEFLDDARLRPELVSGESLEGELEWRDDSAGFAINVRKRAEKFGYRDYRLQGRKILIIDDSQTIRIALERALRKEGCSVETATDGFDALSKIATHRPDIILVDVMMPGLNGFQFCSLLERNEQFRGALVGFMTSQSSPLARARGELAGCEFYLTKPFSPETLIDAISHQVQRISS